MTKRSSKPTKSKNNPWEWSPVDPLQVVVVTQDHKVLLGDEPLTDIELKNLQSEVKALKAFRIWSIFNETVKQKAIEMGFVNSETWERTMSGKMMLFNLGVLKSIVTAIERAPQQTPVAPPRPARRPS